MSEHHRHRRDDFLVFALLTERSVKPKSPPRPARSIESACVAAIVIVLVPFVLMLVFRAR